VYPGAEVNSFLSGFGPSRWLNVAANSARGSLQHADVGSVSDVSEVHAASIVRSKRLG
jgi:hypothetical protein